MSVLSIILDRILQRHADRIPGDIPEVLDKRAATHDQPLDWRASVVDLMKTLDLDASVQHRRELAQELGYPGEWRDSAEMNDWLRRQIMQRVARDGGNVPEELK